MKKNKGFTLAELLIVVAIIAVLVAIAIPVFKTQLHKSEVAVDTANLRSYYAEIQADYITTGEYNPIVRTDWHSSSTYDWTSVTKLNGEKVKLKTGTCAVSFTEGKGYSIVYACNEGHADHSVSFGN